MVRQFRQYWRQTRRFILHNVLHADDPPHPLALGVAIGVFVTFTPTIGAQMLLVVFLAWLLGANKAVGLPVVWISNPATMVPIFYGCYWVGRRILGRPQMNPDWWRELGQPPAGWLDALTFFWQRFLQIASPLWLGSIVVGVALAYPTYYLVRDAISRYRLRRWGQLVPPARIDRATGDLLPETPATQPTDQPDRLAS